MLDCSSRVGVPRLPVVVWLLLTTGIVFLPTTTSGQITNEKAISWKAGAIRSDRAIEMRIADPFARPEQEKAFQRFLHEPYAFDWSDETTLLELTHDLSTRIPFQLDRVSLENIGLTQDSTLSYVSVSAPQAQKGSGNRIDRYGQNQWWRTSEPVDAAPQDQPTNAAVLFQVLQSVEMTIQNHFGQWMLTTIDNVETNLSTRLYEVTELLPTAVEQSDRRGITPPQWLHEGGLIEVIQRSIDPDNWEVLGGYSTIATQTIGHRHWLVISASITTHWKIHSMLNQLNR